MPMLLLLKACPRCGGDIAQGVLDKLEFGCLQCGYLTWVEPQPVPPAPIKELHFIYGWGSFGCLYDGGGCTDTALEAMQAIAEVFSLGPTMAGRLRKDMHLELGSRYGADYAEIVECSCSYREVHYAN